MSKKRKKSVPVVMKKQNQKGSIIHAGTINGVDIMLHAAGKPWRSGTTIVHDCRKKNPKKDRGASKLSIKKETW